MKFIFSIVLSFCCGLMSFSQETYTARKGLRFFPGHLHAVITVDSSIIHYQLFNHWYSWSYMQYRDIKIPFNELDNFSNLNDTLRIILLDNKIKLVDKRNHINRKVKHAELCASVVTMRKISYATELAQGYENMMHFHLYLRDDLKLSEVDFKKRVDKKLEEEIKKRNTNKS